MSDAKPVILLVEDDDQFRGMLTALLTRFFTNYKVVICKDASEAREFLKTTKPAVLLTDNDMPQSPGLLKEDDVGKALIAEAKNQYPDLPCILMSGRDGVGNGVEHFLPKPFIEIKVLIDKLKAVMEQKAVAAQPSSSIAPENFPKGTVTPDGVIRDAQPNEVYR